MSYRLLADVLVAVHFAFIAFVVAGGVLAFWHRAWAVLHLPAVAWGAWTEFTGTICPLTPGKMRYARARARLATPAVSSNTIWSADLSGSADRSHADGARSSCRRDQCGRVLARVDEMAPCRA